MIRVLIVDDEKLSRDSIRILLKRHRDVEVVGQCTSGETAAAQIRKKKPDLVFLDVQMPGKDGFAVVRDIGPESMPVVIFVTAYDRYALRAFETQAIDYLLKPYTDERFEQALARAKKLIAHKGISSIVKRLSGLLSEHGVDHALLEETTSLGPEFLRSLSVQVGRRYVILSVEEITRFEASDYYVRIHSKGRTYLLRQSMSSLEMKLDPREFVRIHRSVIVRIDAIKEMVVRSKESYVELLDGTKCDVSRRKLSALKARIKYGA